MSDTATPSLNTPFKRSVRRVALACIQCRARKVRCDSLQPACNRCCVDEKECEYQKSRRGGRPRRPITAPIQIAAGEPHSPTHSTNNFALSTDSSSLGLGSSGSSTTQSACESLESKSPETVLPNGARLTKTMVDQLLTQYYTYFHVSHPCVLPRWALETRIATDTGIADFLLPILFYIGSIFAQSVDSTSLANAAFEAVKAGQLNSTGSTPNPYFIQALMLYSIAVYWCNEPERGRELLDECINGAFILGMHQKSFAEENSDGDPVLEESWRRTWWQIHVTDIHIAGSTHSYKGLSVKFPITTELPCEEEGYETGIIPTPATLKNYNAREFSDMEFSSFAHLIGFSQGLCRVLATRLYNDTESARTTCANADTMMTAWCSLLPASKRRLLRDDGSVDELLFKATILMHTCIVDLHRQLSNLRYSDIESVSKCAPPPPPESNDSIKEDAPMHTSKVLYAVEKLNSLLTLPTKFSVHTPFIICMIANMTIAHLSACRYIFREPRLSLERDKIRLNMGVLKMLGEFWPAGQREYKTMGTIAREILALKEEEIQIPKETPILPLDTLDYNFPDFEVNWTCDYFATNHGPYSFDVPVDCLV
ncbi:uncharacterized protein CC84DRAFT_1184574 [Paraphaeosphaeria sporulosa]|uniref:Zn(2)-C6 fungal-type domain-containing protein n=1 Tax=Paraphaeosphaeria sporulosa TaxID=1460663 RepID=A0A177CTS6_9PLEO|nr:uncharacterized protein CC84DRAFT_1184574 [Paraphaeosphaeria sporulosa]OAG10591.1 hypothetical protein CC84DRAFT_1184574 [Paraphaeosphaeria sporulosa]